MSSFEHCSSLENVKPRINNANPYQTFALDFRMPADSQAPNLLKIEFSLVLREALNYCLKKRADVFKIWVNSRCVCLSLETREGQYSINSKNYLVHLDPTTNSSKDMIGIQIDESKSLPKALSIKATLLIHHQGKDMDQLLKIKDIFIQLGSEDKSKVAHLQISSLSIKVIKTDSPPALKQNKIPNRFQFYDKCTVLPIGVIKSKEQIYTNFGLSLTRSISSLEEYITKLPPYRSIPFTKENLLYLCHDMKGGYIEDINFDNTISQKKDPTLFYRNFYLEQSEIFNYFSHYNITIPPLHWNIACKRAQTKCIGTFIIEKPIYTQQTLMSQQFALFLIALARTFEFDGYLINIETNIKDVLSMIQWLKYLTNQIHKYIPNSVIIWYDSILAANGVINYQNCLNQANSAFFNVCDGFFTNYVWNQNLLKKSIQTKGNSPKKVYIGNDCFGRGTFGGGMYDLCIGTNKILEYKNDLSIAIFAPGFTYEDNAEYNKQLYQIHELAMYKGYKFRQIAIDQWREVVDGGNGWKQEAQWAVTSYAVCKRSAYLNFNPLEKGASTTVQFTADVGCTNPIPNSQYKIILQLMNDVGVVVFQTGTNEFNHTSSTTDKIITRYYKIQANQQLVGNKAFTVKIVQMGKSSVNWAGHYGPRFRNQKVYILTYQKERNWVSKIPVKSINLEDPYHTLCNVGYGDYFSNFGSKKQQFYNFCADYDFPQTHVINNPMETQINYNDSYIGGTSLLVKRPVIKLLKVMIPKDMNLTKRYYVQVVVRDTKSINIIFKYVAKTDQERIFSASIKNIQELSAGWKRFTFELSTQQKTVSIDTRSIVDITSSDIPYSIGSIKVISQNSPVEPISCLLSISADYVPTNTYYLNLSLKSNNFKRVLVIIGTYSSFVYLSNGQGCLYNAFIPRTDSVRIKIMDIDNGLQQRTLCQKVIEGPLMSQLIFKGSIDL